MRCSSCASENPEGSKFCIECGAPLCKRCTSCGVENLPQAKFCAQCGKSLTAQAGPKATKSAAPPDAGREGERRQLTVMFCDLVGSTALSAQLDPEELRAVVRTYQQTSAAVIERYGGYIAQYLGDGLLVYFGYPAAHEDDAARAVRAGLEIVAAPQDRAVGATPLAPLQIRIGIHTGPVVVGEMGGGSRHEQLALGETPNIAARVQGLAEPDSVVISAATQRLVAGLFNCQDLGPQALKGISIPVSAYRVSGESAAQSRFDVALRTGLMPLIGREHEVGLLQERWKRAQQGEGQVVLLSGEPGIGKSRLVQELKEQLAHEGVTRIEFRCSSYHQNSALYPIIEHLQRMLEFAREDAPAAKLEKLQRTLSHYRFPQADTVPLLAAMLFLPHPDSFPPITVSPQRQKENTQAALVSWLIEEGSKRTVYTTWEDIHWADPSTLDVLNLVVDQAPTASLYVLLTFRPEFIPPWGNRSHLSQITLSRLGRSQVEAMVEYVTGGKALPPEMMQQIVVKTDGVPLFVEELTKTVIEAAVDVGARRAVSLPLAIPATLQDALMARLDRLGTAKEIGQLGATLGREFSYELLQAVSPLDDETLQHGLQQLVAAELVYQRGLLPQAHYLFKHALIQDTAYQSLLKSTRQQYHRQIGQVLEDRFPETIEAQPELLAHHYTEAGLIEQAIPYWQQAGQRAVQRSAHAEAIAHVTKGLEALTALPDGPERTQQELVLQTTLGPALLARKGSGAPEMERAYARALELCRQVGEAPQLFPVLRGLWRFYNTGGQLQTARELGEQLLTLAQRFQAPALLLEAHHALGQTLFCLGELTPARAHLEQSIALYDPQQHRSHAFRYGYDTRVGSLIYLACARWLLGYADQALESVHDALTQTQELAHPFSLAYALHFAAMVHELRGEARAARERAEAALRLSTEQGFPLWVAGGTILRGWALAEQGQGAEGLLQMRQGVAAWRATGARVLQPYYLAVLAEAHRKAGLANEGLSVLAEALDAGHRTGERAREAELYRLKGELLLALSTENHGEAEAHFRQALEVAHRQSAKALELRAAMSVSRLWQHQGKRNDARQLLAEIYDWFTEGFDTADLKDAKALLEELS